MTNLLKKPLFWTNVFALVFAGWLIAGLAFGWTNPNQNPPGGAGVITASAGKVGIASSTPGVTLGVTGNALINGTFQSNTVKTNYVKTTSPTDFNYFAGNVLIGTQSTWVPGPEAQGALRMVSGAGARIDLRDIDSSGTLKNGWQINALNELGSQRRLTLSDFIAAQTRVTIDENGKIGIGTGLPSEKLSVIGKIYVENGIRFGPGATDGIRFADGRKQTSTAVGGIYTTDGIGSCLFANPVTSTCNCNAPGYTAVPFLIINDTVPFGSCSSNDDSCSYQCFIQ